MMDENDAATVPRPSTQTDRMWRIDGRVALVTGASSGLGARFARVLHAAGATVVATARRQDRLEDLAAQCGDRIVTISGDITDARHRQQIIERLKPFGRLDILVNNAGICDDGPIQEQSLDDLLRVVDVNLISVMDICRLAAPLLLAAPSASVINIASSTGWSPPAGPWPPTTRRRAPWSTSPDSSPLNGATEASASTRSPPATSRRS